MTSSECLDSFLKNFIRKLLRKNYLARFGKEFEISKIPKNMLQQKNDPGDGEEAFTIKIGIIGESGLDTPIEMENRTESPVCTPFGKPSDTVIEGDIDGVHCALLSRHGRLHDIMPSNVNYRANIWALRKLGCTHILVTHTCGSLREQIRPGSLVIPHDFIDNTRKRAQTFYDGAVGSPYGVCHLPMSPAFNERTRQHLITAAKEFLLPTHQCGTVIAIEGPRYATKAENSLYRKWGADLVSMSLCPEAVLAKEAGILYATLSLTTNYECWCPKQQIATTHEIVATFRQRAADVQKVLLKAIASIATDNWCEEILKAKMLVCSNFSNHVK